jgi:hypothetical protein
MDALREPILALSLRAACVQEQPVLLPTFEPEHTPTEVLAPVVALVPQSPTSAYNILQPMKLFVLPLPPPRYLIFPSATLYCQNAAGFGEWVINIAPRGERDLREHRRRDRKIFAIIVKKIKCVPPSFLVLYLFDFKGALQRALLARQPEAAE